MNKGIYQHFSIEDRPFLDKGMEWIKKVEDSYAPFLTPFINEAIKDFGQNLWSCL